MRCLVGLVRPSVCPGAVCNLGHSSALPVSRLVTDWCLSWRLAINRPSRLGNKLRCQGSAMVDRWISLFHRGKLGLIEPHGETKSMFQPALSTPVPIVDFFC
eukprot:SAG22_NODE_276_length_13167_cov_8.415825_4_plen_102_part_00